MITTSTPPPPEKEETVKTPPRQIVIHDTHEIEDDLDGLTLAQAAQYFNNRMAEYKDEKYQPKIVYYYDGNIDNTGVRIELYRLETDQEYYSRLNYKQMQDNDSHIKQYQQYIELKKKFEGNKLSWLLTEKE